MPPEERCSVRQSTHRTVIGERQNGDVLTGGGEPINSLVTVLDWEIDQRMSGHTATAGALEPCPVCGDRCIRKQRAAVVADIFPRDASGDPAGRVEVGALPDIGLPLECAHLPDPGF